MYGGICTTASDHRDKFEGMSSDRKLRAIYYDGKTMPQSSSVHVVEQMQVDRCNRDRNDRNA